MSRQVVTTVFQYDELDDSAKERARQWMRDCENQDWSSRAEMYYDDMAVCLKFLGIDVDRTTERWTDSKGKQRSHEKWDFEWSGFCSQGDGLVLRGAWAAERVDLAGLQQHAPQDTVLHQLGIEMTALMLRCPTGKADICTTNYGPGLPGLTLDNECVDSEGEIPMVADEVKALKRLIERACTWAYRQLESNYESDMSDEVIEESIKGNEYEFTEEGDRA